MTERIPEIVLRLAREQLAAEHAGGEDVPTAGPDAGVSSPVACSAASCCRASRNTISGMRSVM